jgi:hypothetical protein
MRAPQELLYESEASLRLVDKAIEELRPDSDAAASDIMDGLGRAAALVERLDDAGPLSDAKRLEIAASLREELSSLSTRLQFQHITS